MTGDECSYGPGLSRQIRSPHKIGPPGPILSDKYGPPPTNTFPPNVHGSSNMDANSRIRVQLFRKLTRSRGHFGGKSVLWSSVEYLHKSGKLRIEPYLDRVLHPDMYSQAYINMYCKYRMTDDEVFNLQGMVSYCQLWCM